MLIVFFKKVRNVYTQKQAFEGVKCNFQLSGTHIKYKYINYMSTGLNSLGKVAQILKTYFHNQAEIGTFCQKIGILIQAPRNKKSEYQKCLRVEISFLWYDLICHKKLYWFENLQVQNHRDHIRLHYDCHLQFRA